MTGRLAKKVAIVTGAAQGFGLAIVEKLVEEGAKVVVVDVNEDGAARTARAHSGCKYVAGDITERGLWEKALQVALNEFGRLDIVVNNAAISILKITTEWTDEEFDRIFRVNVKGVFISSQVIIPYFQGQGGGIFINMSSVGGPRPRAEGAWYGATKAAVTTATKAMAREWAPHNIRFNAVAPTLADTGMYQVVLCAAGLRDGEETRQKLAANIPLGRFCKTTDVANAVCFLASDEASFITGVELPVDGGVTV